MLSTLPITPYLLYFFDKNQLNLLIVKNTGFINQNYDLANRVNPDLRSNIGNSRVQLLSWFLWFTC